MEHYPRKMSKTTISNNAVLLIAQQTGEMSPTKEYTPHASVNTKFKAVMQGWLSGSSAGSVCLASVMLVYGLKR
jgi:hypothetical protein